MSREREFVIAASELFAFVVLALPIGLLVPWSVLTIFIINTIAGTIIFDIKLNKAVVPIDSEIEMNNISIIYGLRKILRNNFWFL
jgi:hypothetical protein